MTDIANKLQAIAERRKKLAIEEAKIVEQRKQVIGKLAERFNLLTASDAIIAGLFADAEAELKNRDSEKVKLWNKAGERITTKQKGISRQA